MIVRVGSWQFWHILLVLCFLLAEKPGAVSLLSFPKRFLDHSWRWFQLPSISSYENLIPIQTNPRRKQNQFSILRSFITAKIIPISNETTSDNENNISSKSWNFSDGNSGSRSVNIYSSLIDQLKQIFSSYIAVDDKSQHWKLIGHDRDIYFWKLIKPVSPSTEANKWPCFKSFTTVNVSMEEFKNILFDSSKATVLNKYCLERIDVEIIEENTKVVWLKSKSSFKMKPFDFSTLLHAYESTVIQSDGYPSVYFPDAEGTTTTSLPSSRRPAIIILSRCIKHPQIPVVSDYARSETIFGVNILTPNRTNPSHTDFLSISHVKYAGIIPSVASMTGYQGTVDYLKHVKDVCKNK